MSLIDLNEEAQRDPVIGRSRIKRFRPGSGAARTIALDARIVATAGVLTMNQAIEKRRAATRYRLAPERADVCVFRRCASTPKMFPELLAYYVDKLVDAEGLVVPAL